MYNQNSLELFLYLGSDSPEIKTRKPDSLTLEVNGFGNFLMQL